MIDIHSHILPNLDDGPQAIQESIAMARMAQADGITDIFCTPHHHWAHCDLEDMREHVDVLQYDLIRNGIAVQLYTGHEVHLYHQTKMDWYSGMALRLGESNYILVEPDFYHYTADTDALLELFFAEGLTPIMAHPERIEPIQANIGLIAWFVEAGGLTQLTAKSLTRNDASPARACAEELLRNDMAHIIASDAHGVTYRPIGLSAARQAAAQIVGEERAWAMVRETPQKIIEGIPSGLFMDAYQA